MGHMRLISIVLFLQLWLRTPTLATKVLLIPENFGSNLITFTRLGEVLTQYENEVTMVTASSVPVPNFMMDGPIKLEYFNYNGKALSENKEFTNKVIGVALNGSTSDKYAIFNEQLNIFNAYCEAMLQDPIMMNKLQVLNFDFAIVSPISSCGAVIALKLDLPFGYLADTCYATVLRIPEPISYVPRHFYPDVLSDRMSFHQRLVTFLQFWKDEYLTELSRNNWISNYVPEKSHINFLELRRQGLLCFNMKPSVLEAVKPLTPNIVPLEDLLARPAAVLSNDLQRFVEGADDGIIIVSFGSWLTSMPYEIAQKFFEAFAQVKQRVIWKYHGKIPKDAPKNVMITEWLPQNDLLGHPKTRLIIYHGGTCGLTESLYHGVPIIGIPLYLDQYQNIALVQQKGFGILINIKSIATNELLVAINKILKDPSYKNNIKESQEILQNPLVTSGQAADYWLKHVLKYGDKYIRPYSLDMSFIAYHSIDVTAFLLLLLLIVSLVTYKTLKMIVLSCCCLIRGRNPTIKFKAT